jgi:hypothetical protein
VLRERGEYMQRQLVCFWYIARDEPHTAFHQSADDMHVPRKPVELCDDQYRPLSPALI